MIPLGYLYKQVSTRPEWLGAPHVKDVYSVSGCVSKDFTDYIGYWKHNGYWLFDSPGIISEVAKEASISLDGHKLFYYEAYELQFDEAAHVWAEFKPELSFSTNVLIPEEKKLEGFDVTSFSLGNAPECSPLSCNAQAMEVPTNEHCLIESLVEAKAAVEQNSFHCCEPGPYRIIAVYSVSVGEDSGGGN